MPACKSNCCMLVRVAHYRYSHLDYLYCGALILFCIQHCKYRAIMLYNLQHLMHHGQHAQPAHTMYLVSQLCMILYTARPPHQTRLVPSFPLAIYNTLLPGQVTLCQPAAHLLLNTCRPSVKISTSQSYHHVRRTCTSRSCVSYDVQTWHTKSLLGFAGFH